MKVGVTSRNPHNVEAAKRSGFDFFQPAITAIMAMDDDEFESYAQLVDQLKDNSFDGTTAGILFVPGDIPIVGPDADLAAVDAYLDRAIPRIGRLGIVDIAWGGPKARACPEGWSRETAVQQFVEAMRLCADRLQPVGGRIALEPMGPKMTNTFNSLAESVELARTVNREGFGVAVDIAHMFACGDGIDDVMAAEGHVLQWHLTDDTGDIPRESDRGKLAAVFAALRHIGYGGTAALECKTEDFDLFERETLPMIREIVNG